MTLRGLLTAATLLIASITGLLYGSAAVFLARQDAVSRKKLEATARAVRTSVTAAVAGHDSEIARHLLASAASLSEADAVSVFLPDGRLFASHVRGGANENPHRFRTSRNQDIDFDVVQPLTADNRLVGTLYLAGNRPLRIVRGAFLFGSAAILSVLISAGVVLQLRRRILLPIQSMSTVALSVTQGRDYTMRARVGSGKELRELGDRFNAMISDFNARDLDLRQSTWRLEDEVLRRTAELSGANTLLWAAKQKAEEVSALNAELRLRNESILQSVSEGIFGLDANGVVTFVNRAGAEMLGWSSEQLVGRISHTLIHPVGEEAAQDTCRVCSLSSSRRSENTRFRTRNGEILQVEYTSRPMHGGSGSVEGIVVTFRDIAERLAVEKMKDEFVSTVSHELRTPLTSIRGALGLVNSGRVGTLQPKGQHLLHIAVTNADRLIRLVNDILDIERAASGRFELEKTTVVAGDLMKNATEVMQALADQTGVRLEALPCSETIEVDSDRMMQTITNLIGNAIKFSPAGKRVLVSALRDDDRIVFAVADEGRGIPAEKLNLVFERFRQVDASDSRDKGGSGLGLAIVRSIVTAHGGDVWVESTVGIGSTFFVAIPAGITSHVQNV